MRLKPHVSGC